MDADRKNTVERLSGWGRSSYATCCVIDAVNELEVLGAMRQSGNAKLLARGAGRSYGDTALNQGGYVVRTTRMKSVHSFDPHSGEIVIDPGVTFGDLLQQYSTQGWIAPVTPGTQFATLAGAIANDVHGKNHDFDGSIGDHIVWFDLAVPDGRLRRVDRDNAPELFAATLGGIGLTGVITRICLRLKRIPSRTLLVHERRMAGLDEYLDAMEEARVRYRYSVGWIDGTAQGRRLGRGILETADYVEDSALPPRRRTPVRMPIDLPTVAINPYTVGLFNQLYFHRINRNGRERRLDLETFFYPLDSILEWNRMYGRRGFVQFQCALPNSEARVGMRKLLTTIAASGGASFLAVIKTLGRAAEGYLSFPMPGITLAFDFPMTPHVRTLLEELHSITVAHGGRIYLAKDSCLSATHLRQMYPQLGRFRAVLDQVDPQRQLRSDMSLRLQL